MLLRSAPGGVDVETRYGVLKVPDIETDVIGRFLSRYGEWAWDEVCFVADLLPFEGARILDVGAFVGTFSLGLALRRQLGFVCLVEANGVVAPLLADNVHRNCSNPTSVVAALVAGSCMTVTDGHAEAGNLGSMSFASEPSVLRSEAAPLPSRIVTLSDLRAEHGEFDLIKLDAEGMESDILRADAEYLARGGTTIWAECNEDLRSLELGKLLLSWNLDLYYFAFPSHNPDNFRGDRHPIFPFAYEAGLLAAPKTQPVLDDVLSSHRCILLPVRNLVDLKDALWRTPRWGLSDWLDVGSEQVAALAGRALRGELFESFLAPGWSAADPPGEVARRRLEATEKGLQTAEALAFERLALLDAEAEHRERAETALAQAAKRTLDLLSEIGPIRESAAAAESAREVAEEAQRRAETAAGDLERRAAVAEAQAAELERRAAVAEAQAAELERRAAVAEAQVVALEISTTWRLTAPLRVFIGARPKFHGLLRRGRSVVAVALGRRR